MEIAVIILFFAGVIILSLCRGFRRRTMRENIFYILCICISFTVLMIESIS